MPDFPGSFYLPNACNIDHPLTLDEFTARQMRPGLFSCSAHPHGIVVPAHGMPDSVALLLLGTSGFAAT
jgi:hypothetical protein